MFDPDSNPPAFPSTEPVGGYWPGMTLRDYFAGHALLALLTEKAIEQAQAVGEAERVPYVVSAAAYAFADAMLQERQKTK